MTVLDDLMRISKKGYLDKTEDIEAALDGALNYTFGEIDRNSRFPINVIMNYMGLQASKPGMLRLRDALGIIRCRNRDEVSSGQVHTDMMLLTRLLLNAGSGLPWIRMLTSVRINSLFNVLAQKGGDVMLIVGARRMIKRLAYENANFQIEEDTTLGELMKTLNGEFSSVWNPSVPIENHAEKITGCCSVIKLIFVDLIGSALTRDFDRDEVIERVWAFDPEEVNDDEFFEGLCEDIEEVEEPEECCEPLPDENGFVIENGVLIRYAGGAAEVRIPDGVSEIGAGAFFDNDSIESVYIPDSVEVIGEKAFRDCDNLRKVRMPQRLRVIGLQAFTWCKALSAVFIAKTVTRIGAGAFCECSLRKAFVPEGVREFGEAVFAGNPYVRVYYNGRWYEADSLNALETALETVCGELEPCPF
ncbi:MAG: leucine-rich repeat domain-containing protein [Lachnospiraceae bacterium]|nr:leucine-rich repeat domain-containing protein [Ruminococcus sp.]MCM1274260.1 leucine-rich repeat domain-containing protein [Lachnospiraceae bacterium]